jgi:YVTN family beta-propeller protein
LHHLLGVQRAWADSVIKTITVGTGPYGDLFDPDNGYIYVANVANVTSNSVSVIDGSTNTMIASVQEKPNQYPRELAFDSKNGYIYVADVYSNSFCNRW